MRDSFKGDIMGCTTTCTIDFIPTSKEELKEKIVDGKFYEVEYENHDYFNGENVVEKAVARAIVNEDGIMFLVKDPYGMEEFISNVRLVK